MAKKSESILNSQEFTPIKWVSGDLVGFSRSFSKSNWRAMRAESGPSSCSRARLGGSARRVGGAVQPGVQDRPTSTELDHSVIAPCSARSETCMRHPGLFSYYDARNGRFWGIHLTGARCPFCSPRAVCGRPRRTRRMPASTHLSGRRIPRPMHRDQVTVPHRDMGATNASRLIPSFPEIAHKVWAAQFTRRIAGPDIEYLSFAWLLCFQQPHRIGRWIYFNDADFQTLVRRDADVS